MAQYNGYNGYRKIINRIKQRRAWLLLRELTTERSCTCEQPALLLVSKVLSSLVVKVLEFGIKIIYTNGSYARHYF
ncbi:hypothetical protein J6590_084040 [Homalodisca vitripennis]|nr:hypothetical protein J6590_084040 [Homalodisca vitripennis]